MIELRDYGSLDHPDVASAWDALESNGACPSIFGTRPWVTAWARQFGSGLDTLVVVGLDGGTPVGMATLFVGTRGRVLFPVNFLSPKGEFLVRDDSAEEFTRGLLDVLSSRSGGALFRGIPLDSSTHRALRETAATCFTSVERTRRVSPFIATAGTWEDYYAGQPRKVTHEWERKARKLEAAGDVRVRRFEGDPDVDRLIDAFVEVEAASWKDREGTSIGARGIDRFYHDVAGGLAERGAFLPFWLELDGRVVAFLLGAVWEGTYFAMKTSYDDEFGHLAPGTRLFREAVEYAFGAGLARFDFLGEKARWKDEWATGWLEHVDVTLYRKNLRGAVARAVDTRLKPLVRRARRG